MSLASETLQLLRLKRGFDVSFCLNLKAELINLHFRTCGLNAVVLGMSGGVDSYVTMALLCHAASLPGSPIRKVVGLSVPFSSSPGATGQSEAERKAELGTRRIQEQYPGIAEIWHVPGDEALQSAHRSLVSGAGRLNPDYISTPWSEGQMLSVMRTPIFYGAAALLRANGFRSVVSGTTNRDEGAFIGFFGKASDAMVDIQPISDLHKSEVYALAEFFLAPVEITGDVPRGDVWDSRTDEEMIGAPYWAVELFSLLHEMERPDLSLLKQLWEDPEIRVLFQNICNLHEANSHKYQVGNPAIHFDVYTRFLLGGWAVNNSGGRT